MIEQNFGRTLTVGIEEELMILDAATLELSPSVHVFVERAEQLRLAGALKTELMASVVELATPTCESVDAAIEHLRELRRAAGSIAQENGLAVAASGTHPVSRPQDQEIAPEERYREFVEYAGVSARRQGVNGLHVHVGMPSAEDCMRVLELVLPWLPLALALSANSPYLAGEETGMMSIRAEVLALLPRHSAPPAFRTYGDWEVFVERLVTAGVAGGYTNLWWDARPHPSFGTIEIRVADQPTSLERTRALAALLHRLCAWALEQPAREHEPGDRGVYEQNRWAAARFGPRARLVHPDRAEALPVERLLAELPVAAGGLDGASCEGDRQLDVGRSRGLCALCADLVARSLA